MAQTIDIMDYRYIETSRCHVRLALCDTGRREAHAIVGCKDVRLPFATQIEGILEMTGKLAADLDMAPVFMRWFLSDATNQAGALPVADCASTAVQQPPLDGAKAALWIVLEADADYTRTAPGVYSSPRGRIWMGDTPPCGDTAYALTAAYLDKLDAILRQKGATMLDHCLRTWFFVRDVDVNYAGVVSGRNDMFARAGLSRDTHFISSTGIEGRNPDPAVSVSFNAVCDTSLRLGQMRLLYGATHLNPTIEYGVAFERGTAVDYADRRHVYISGTASIDNKGEIAHPGDILGQTERMLENISVLLAEADCTTADVAHFIVYLRDTADYAAVRDIFDTRFPDAPRVITLAPVCRPGWLIETECMAVKKLTTDYAAF